MNLQDFQLYSIFSIKKNNLQLYEWLILVKHLKL
jgi:hypothetical protein